MAHRKTPFHTIQAEDISELIEIVRNDITPNAVDPTQFVIPPTGGTMDEFTEKITYSTSEVLFNASGVVGAVSEEDMVYGLNGQIKIGDVKVTYPYEAVSGVLAFGAVEEVKLLSPGVSGMYHIEGRWIDVIGDAPVFVDYALKPRVNENG